MAFSPSFSYWDSYQSIPLQILQLFRISFILFLGEGKFLDDGPQRSLHTPVLHPKLMGNYRIYVAGNVKDVNLNDLRHLLELLGADMLTFAQVKQISEKGSTLPHRAIVVVDGLLLRKSQVFFC